MTFTKAGNQFLRASYDKCNKFLSCEITMEELKTKLPYDEDDIVRLFCYLNRSKCFESGANYDSNSAVFNFSFSALGIVRIENEISL